jgi:hypothetical protein
MSTKVTVHQDRDPIDALLGQEGTFTAHDGEGNSGEGYSREGAIKNLEENIRIDKVKNDE